MEAKAGQATNGPGVRSELGNLRPFVRLLPERVDGAETRVEGVLNTPVTQQQRHLDRAGARLSRRESAIVLPSGELIADSSFPGPSRKERTSRRCCGSGRFPMNFGLLGWDNSE